MHARPYADCEKKITGTECRRFIRDDFFTARLGAFWSALIKIR